MSKINETNYPRRTQANYEDTDMFVIQKAGGNTYTTRIEDLREALSIPFVNCSTARNVNAKKVTVDGFTLRQGSRILVRFTNTGSSNPSSGNLTLEVNSTGAKTIVDGHTNKTALTYSSASLFYNNYVAEFVYDGTYWVYVNRDNNTTYTGGSLKTSTAKTGTAQSNITNTIAASTTMDNAIGTLLNNDVTLSRTLSDKTNQNALAKVENGATASQSYAIGEHFMRDGAFCTAIAAITSGGSFTLNTNYKVDDVANNLEQLNSDLASKLNWKGFGVHGIGNYQPITDFPSNWSEMLFVFKYSTILLSVHLPKSVVDAYSGTDPDAMYNGFYYTSGINAGVVVTYNKTKFSAYGFYYNGASVASSATCIAYYR